MLTSAEMRVLDRNAEWMGVKILDLMENAGKAVAEAALAMGGKGTRVLLVCGTGNNGGDGLTAARYMKGAADVTVLLAKPPSELSTPEALANYERIKDDVRVEVATPGAALPEADLIVDALMGIGVKGAVKEPYASLIKAINAAGVPILSVDVPSGFEADLAVTPTATLAIHDVKAGMTEANAGTIQVAPIGIPKDVERTIGPGELLLYPHPKPDSHKGDNGRLLVIGGGPFTGAPALSAFAAYGIGVDAVHLATPSNVYPVLAAMSPNFIVHPLGGTRLVRTDAATVFDIASGMDAVVIGPGLGTSDATKDAVRDVVKGLRIPIVIDADAFPAMSGHLADLRGKAGVMTPHAKEFEVVSGERIPADAGREASARGFAKKTGFTVILKGRIDVVTDGSRLKVTRGGNPGMTVGGTGDVLAGLVGGLLAKGAAPYDAARMAAFVSKYAGDLAFDDLSYGFTAKDVADRVPRVLRKFL